MADTKPAFASEVAPTDRPAVGKGLLRFAIGGVALLLIALIAIQRLQNFPYRLSWSDAWRGIKPLLPLTGFTALKVWALWGWGTVAVAGALLRLDPELDVVDAVLGGASGLWVAAFIAGNLLGPIGLFREVTIWLLLAGLSLWSLPRSRAISLKPPSAGQELALLAWALLTVSLLPLQLGSPVPPYMDVLSYPSSAQRILTFHVYHPFDNNPIGLFPPSVQNPALELFYALLALGSHTGLATLAETAAMVPMAGLIIFGTYRLGETLFNDTAGGMAALLLFFTNTFRRSQGMRGTAVDFALVALGLAFFLDSRRSRALMAIGSVILATAVSSHAIQGGLAMIVASAGVLLWLASGDIARFAVGTACLAGATLIGSTEIPIALAHRVAYPILPGLQLAGIALVVFAVRKLPPVGWSLNFAAAKILGVAGSLAFLLGIALRNRVGALSIYATIAGNQPFLVFFCSVGLLLVVIISVIGHSLPNAGLCAVALLLGVAGNVLDPFLTHIGSSLASRMMTSDVLTKLADSWCPYFLVLPAGLIFALCYDYASGALSLFVLLLILVYPWRLLPGPTDADTVQHSVAEQWAFNLHTAARGYFQGARDPRWTIDDEGFALLRVLDAEVRAGRITPATHILHLTESIDYWIFLQYVVFTGINDDPIEFHDDRQSVWIAGGRVHWIADLPAELAKKPPYILEQAEQPSWGQESPPGYERIFGGGYLRLFRRKDL